MAARLSFSGLLLAVLLVLHAIARASTPSPPSAGAYDPSLYLPRLTGAEKALAREQADLQGAPPGRAPALDGLATVLSFVGDVDGAIAAYDQKSRAVPPLAPRQVAQMRQVADARVDDAIRAIVEQARSKQVVLINEAHHVPMHRAFSQKLAAELHKIGYTYLAAEAFRADGEGRVRLTDGGRTRNVTGLYTSEPVFAEFVNAAVANGWKLIPYDTVSPAAPGTSPAESFRQREQTQARNLVERIFARDPGAKVLIHVGYGHLYKHPPDSSLLVMADYLYRMTSLNMLHVDQTEFYAHPDRAHEGPVYAGLVDKFPATEPFVLRSPDGSFPVMMGKQGMVDMQVIFPRYAMRDGRPEWLQTLAGRSPHAIPAELLPKQGRRLIKAVRAADGPDAVPADIVLVEAGKPVPKLMLPPGEFRYSTEE